MVKCDHVKLVEKADWSEMSGYFARCPVCKEKVTFVWDSEGKLAPEKKA